MKNILRLWLLVLLTLPAWAQAQKISVSGRVVDAQGQGLPGTTVLERGTTNGGSTNSDGGFVLSVAPDATVTIQAVGFLAQQVPVNGRTDLGEIRLSAAVQDLNEVVVTGSRATEGRSNILTTAPVDVIAAREIRAFAQTDVAQALTFTAPSFQSARQTIADGTDHLDPASLRGLGPDQVLVLVNGKRRHSQALVNVNGTVGRGSVGTDLNAIPISAVKRIEVLRDGAAALYGSDAIAGVINVQLKDDSTGVNVSTQAGETMEKDGKLFQADANVGLGLGGKGFVDVSGLFSNRSYTNRSGVDTAPLIYLGDNSGNYPSNANTPALREALKRRDDQLVAQRGYDRRNLRFGNSDARNYGGFLNGAFRLAPAVELYASAGIMQREGKSAGFSRLPGRYSAQTDSTKYPNGFLPFIEPTIKDRSVLAGLRGSVLGFGYDLSNVYGLNSIDFRVSNSINASLPLGTSPTEFYAGQIFFRQNTSNLTFIRKFTELGPLSTLNVAFGGEFRADNYRIKAGEESSYINGGRRAVTGPPAANGTPTTGPAAAGAQVFPGFQPSNELDKSRTNVAGYLDLESDVTERLLVHLAGRAENYSDFGSNVSGQAAARFSVFEGLALRGSIGNGFRAPSLQQRFFTNQSTQFVQGAPQTVLTANNDNGIVRQFGVGSLKQEESTNYSVGLTARVARTLTLTADAYQIDINDRIVLSSQFNRTNALVAGYLNAAGAAGVGVGVVQFFANAVNTRTRGIDVVLNERLLLSPNSTLALTAAANFTETKVRNVIVPNQLQDPVLRTIFFDRQQTGRLESAQPRSKIVLSANYRVGKLGVEARTVRFGEVKYYDARVDAPTADNGNFLFSSIDQTFKAKWVTDATISFQLIKQVGLAVGANNLFNVYPDKYRVDPRNNENNFSTAPATRYASNFDNTNRGRTIYNPNQFGFNGAFYFAKLTFSL